MMPQAGAGSRSSSFPRLQAPFAGALIIGDRSYPLTAPPSNRRFPSRFWFIDRARNVWP